MLEHGGALRRAAARHGIPVEQWLDLSTGINPDGYPAPAIPAEAWHRLPEDGDGLAAAAAVYYGTPRLLAVAGSQQAIAWLPRVLAGRRVAVLEPTYGEHAAAWTAAGREVEREVRRFAATDFVAATESADIVVVANPNNPDGVRFTAAELRAGAARLAARGGWLIVDEAFADAEPERSLAADAGRPGLIVLRSLGKFFGLAGARVGFVLAPEELRDALAERIGPWPVAGPARLAALAALADRAWQVETRARLAAASARLDGLLADAGLAPAGGCALFRWCPHARPDMVAEALAARGILVRRFAAPTGLRFGLPGDEAGWRRLAEALEELPCAH